MKETNLVNQTINALARHFGSDLLIFKRVVGNVYTVYGARIKVGAPGQADVYGWVFNRHSKIPIPFEIEFKTKDNDRSDDQVAWGNTCKRMNIPYFIARENSLPLLIKSFEQLKSTGGVKAWKTRALL